MIDHDPMGEDYWLQYNAEEKKVDMERNRRDDLYGGCDPATWGWRRPTAQEIRDEREDRR